MSGGVPWVPWYHVAASGNLLHQKTGLPQIAAGTAPPQQFGSLTLLLSKFLEFSSSLTSMLHLHPTFSSQPARRASSLLPFTTSHLTVPLPSGASASLS